MLNKANELQDVIASRSSLGQILGDAIKQQLGLPANAFKLSIDFQDADANLAGFQATAVVKIEIDKSVTKSYAFDLNLPDLGPVEVTHRRQYQCDRGRQIELDFGFRFGTFTPYLLDSTRVNLTSSIDSTIRAAASLVSVGGLLEGDLQLKESESRTVATGQSSYTLEQRPTENWSSSLGAAASPA